MMWDQFSPQLRNVALTAQKEANLMNSASLDAAHFLLALAREKEGVLARYLHANKISACEVAGLLKGHLRIRSGEQSSPTFMSGQTVALLDLATSEAHSAGSASIETTHLLLALTHASSGIVAQVLTGLGMNRERILQQSQLTPAESQREIKNQVALRTQHHGQSSSFRENPNPLEHDFIRVKEDKGRKVKEKR